MLGTFAARREQRRYSASGAFSYARATMRYASSITRPSRARKKSFLYPRATAVSSTHFAKPSRSGPNPCTPSRYASPPKSDRGTTRASGAS
jgi:hypothetical protein